MSRPELPSWYSNPTAKSSIERPFAITRALRKLRSELEISSGVSIPAAYYEVELNGAAGIITSQDWTQQLTPGRPKEGKYVSESVEGVDLHLRIEGLSI